MSKLKSNTEEINPPEVVIVSYHESLAPWFKSINVEWLNKHFDVTPQDLDILENPERIINSGGEILFAIVGENVVGTAAILKIDVATVELIKMGVDSSFQGKGVGKALMAEVLNEAIKMKATKIILETAMSLVPAISLYKKAGFIQTSGEEPHPIFGRTTFKMEKVLNS